MSERLVKQARREPRCPSLAELDRLLQTLARPSTSSDPAELIDRITALEKLKSAAAAAQARETVAFTTARLVDEEAAGVSARSRGKGVAGEIALARRESPRRAASLVGLAEVLVHQMPHTLAALSAGDLSEWRATLMARETACLSPADRGQVDDVMADRLGSLSDRHLVAEAQRHAYRLDPHGYLGRSKKAAEDRRVTLRPAPDVMTRLCALLPTVQGVAVYAALCREADRRKADGDPRTRSQLIADILVERTTGQRQADQTPLEVHLIMTARSLLGDDLTPAIIPGYGPIPAPAARDHVRGLHAKTRTWVRRLITDPVTGRLVGYDTRRRALTGTRRQAIVWRDQWCRTPWCGAPIRHIDHPLPHADGGETSEANSQGVCETCNYVKEGVGWFSRPHKDHGAGESVTVTTPTGHSYESRPPPLPGAPDDPGRHFQPAIDVPYIRLSWNDLLRPGDAA